MQKTAAETGHTCPKCQGAMLQGFIPGFSQVNMEFLSSWHPGVPQRSFWSGIRRSPTGGLPIRAFHCAGCGFLELYAGMEFEAQ